MSTFYPNPTAVLSRGGTDIPDAVVQQVTLEVDEGWTWYATVQGDDIDPFEASSTVYQIDFTDGLGNSQSTPSLTAAQYGYSHAYSQDSPATTSLSGTDAAIFKLRTANQSFPSYALSDAETIIADVATRAGLTISGVPDDIYVIEEDIKNAKLSDALGRFLDVAAYEFWVNTSGAVVCRAWEASAGDLSFDWSSLSHAVDKRNLFTGIRLGKRSSYPADGEQVYTFDSTGVKNQAISPSLTGPTGFVETTAEDGYLLWICFFNADDEYVAYQDYTFGDYPEGDLIVPSGTGPAVRFTCQVAISGAGQVAARVRLGGTPPDTHPEGIDVEFLTPAVNTAGSGGEDNSLGAWPYESDFIDQLFPSQTWAEARQPYILSRLNADADTLSMVGPLQCGSGVQLFLRYTYNSNTYKVKSITWDFVGNQTSITLVRLETSTL
jgi:hypothetical protein